MSVAEEIEHLHDLKERGALNEWEFQQAKERLLERGDLGEGLPGRSGARAVDERSWSMFIHFAQFCGYLVPLAGLIVPIILWQIKKDESAFVDANGKAVANWILSEIIYLIIFGLLALVVIGIPLLILLGLLGIVFPILGGLKASNGECWDYPGSITFFR